MEFVSVKRGKNRRKRAHLKKRRREQKKLEVKFAKRQRFISERGEKLTGGTMDANSFWENYTAAQEWQKRHSVIWWKTRCIALEYENQILRDKLRSMACQGGQQSSMYKQKNRRYKYRDEEQEATTEEAENLEFQVDEDMMSFLEQSMRHKIELKKKKESESCAKGEGDDTNIQGGANWVKMRNNNAKLLYGEASSRILAMETALQTTIDRHKDKAKPQYWPIIPLKP